MREKFESHVVWMNMRCGNQKEKGIELGPGGGGWVVSPSDLSARPVVSPAAAAQWSRLCGRREKLTLTNDPLKGAQTNMARWGEYFLLSGGHARLLWA